MDHYFRVEWVEESDLNLHYVEKATLDEALQFAHWLLNKKFNIQNESVYIWRCYDTALPAQKIQTVTIDDVLAVTVATDGTMFNMRDAREKAIGDGYGWGV